MEANQIRAVKGGTGSDRQGKLDAAVEQYVVASGTKLRLVSGESAIELNANGKISLIGKEFNFFVEGDGHITTGGKLHLNTSGAKRERNGAGAGTKEILMRRFRRNSRPRVIKAGAVLVALLAMGMPEGHATKRSLDVHCRDECFT